MEKVYIETYRIKDEKTFNQVVRQLLRNFLLLFIVSILIIALGGKLLGEFKLFFGGLILGLSISFMSDLIAIIRGKRRLVKIEGDYQETKIFS